MTIREITKLFVHAWKLYNRNSFSQCLELLENIERQKSNVSKPLLVKVLYLKAEALHDLRRYSDSIKAYSKLILLEKSDVAYANKALALWETKKYRDALKNYLSAIRLNPSNAIALRGAAEMYIKLDKPKVAISYLKRALKLNPKYGDAFLSLGVANYRTGDWLESYRSLQRALQINPDDEIAKLGISKIERHFELEKLS